MFAKKSCEQIFTNNEVSDRPLLVAKDKKYAVIVPEPESETPPLPLFGGYFTDILFQTFPQGYFINTCLQLTYWCMWQSSSILYFPQIPQETHFWS